MVRKLTLEGKVELAEPEIVFKYLFSDDRFTKSYHKKVNYDPYAEVSGWNEDCEREVKYVASVQAPKMITKLLGDNFPVTEVQKYFKNGDSITITSNPSMNAPGVDFFTYVETVLSPNKKGGCIVTANVTLGVKGRLWGLEGAVENFMESKTRETFDEWMTLATVFCQEAALANNVVEDVNQECFFDAEEEVGATALTQMQEPPPTSVNRILSRVRAVFTGNEDTASSGLNMFTQTVLRDANDIKISCDALKGHVVQLNAKLLRMESDMAYVKSILETRQQQAPISMLLTWRYFGLGVATGLSLGFAYMHIQKFRGKL